MLRKVLHPAKDRFLAQRCITPDVVIPGEFVKLAQLIAPFLFVHVAEIAETCDCHDVGPVKEIGIVFGMLAVYISIPIHYEGVELLY